MNPKIFITSPAFKVLGIVRHYNPRIKLSLTFIFPGAGCFLVQYLSSSSCQPYGDNNVGHH